jgi:hypothetical protein
MNKQDLIAKIATDTGGTKTDAAAAVESLLDGITRALKKGDPITFVGFGDVQDLTAARPTCAQPAHRCPHQNPQAPRRPVHRGQSAQVSG